MLYTEKNSLVCIKGEDGEFHITWEIDNYIVGFEYTPENYPSSYYLNYKTIREYFDSIKDVDWIINNISTEELDIIINKLTSGEIY